MRNSATSVPVDERSDTVPAFTDDLFYRALAARPRRRLLYYLLGQSESTITELADVLCGWEASAGEVVSTDQHKQTRIALEHNHLPCLADASLLTVDREAGTVELADLEQPVVKLIRRSIEHDRQ